jgi:hypothetical protein
MRTVEEYLHAGFSQAQAEILAARSAPAAGATPPPGAGAPASPAHGSKSRADAAERYPNHTPKTIARYDADGDPVYLHEVEPMTSAELKALGYSDEQVAAIHAEQQTNAPHGSESYGEMQARVERERKERQS